MDDHQNLKYDFSSKSRSGFYPDLSMIFSSKSRSGFYPDLSMIFHPNLKYGSPSKSKV